MILFTTAVFSSIILLLLIGARPAFADRYRSNAITGNWNAIATWQKSIDGGATWV